MTNGFLPPKNESRIFQLRELKLPLNLEFQAALVSKFNMPEPPCRSMECSAASTRVNVFAVSYRLSHASMEMQTYENGASV